MRHFVKVYITIMRAIDKKIANDLLNFILENAIVNDNFILLNVMDEITNNIETTYPSLFN